MKVSVDGEPLFEISKIQKKVMCNDIREEIFEEDMKGRMEYIVTHKYEACLKRLRSEWDPKLKALGVTMVPTDDDKYAELVFSQLEYKSRSQREHRNDIDK